MTTRIQSAAVALALAFAASAAWAKLPPPPPLDEKGKAAAEEKKAKDAVAAAKEKEIQAAAEERAVKNYQANMKKAGKPIPKPTPIVAAAAPAAAGAAPAKPGDAKAVAMLEPTKGNTARGSVTFAQMGGKVRVSAQLTGLKPNAEHGFHVHEKGDCSSGDGMSAGGHFNPSAKAHGNYHAGGDRHVGDMPNVKSDAQGNASASFEVTGMSIGSGAADIVGKGLIVHRDPDDYKSQPAGNAGPRLACAVIRRG